VTKFLVDTCRLLLCTIIQLLDAMYRGCIDVWRHGMSSQDDDQVFFIPLTTGSVAEFYIQPMMCVIMVIMTNWKCCFQLWPDMQWNSQISTLNWQHFIGLHNAPDSIPNIPLCL